MSTTEEQDTQNKRQESEEPAASDNRSEEENMEHLRRFFAEKLNFSKTEKKEKVKVLNDVSIDGIVNYINENDCKNIITMAGAGISTSAGIPDFRSPGTGLYHNLQKYNLPHPQAIFELDFFHNNPKPFFELAKELYPGTFKPTLCHYFVKMLDEKGLLLRHYTQNIDTLERVAGIPEDKIVEAHGTFHIGHCLKCRQEYSQDWMKEIIFKDQIPSCEKCSGVVKPDIIFFGEVLPSKFYNGIRTDYSKCDLLIIIGTSLAVQPFASLVDRVEDHVPRILINREKSGHRSSIMTMLGMGGGLNFDSKDNTRDVCWLGDCDEGCLLFAEKLGWADELLQRVIEEHEKIAKVTNRQKIDIVSGKKPNSTEKQELP
ncbi:NAD-dependent protein deacetylase Sirt2-like isoform X1 [Diabrotica undecimpunctata]|uniref:NAD-dependent protein deacetylase Sirt2-like isoform X1 n=1 Tax=Diabrotica undecimpunctata TaxID=50387 RepID=UPI003B63F2B4